MAEFCKTDGCRQIATLEGYCFNCDSKRIKGCEYFKQEKVGMTFRPICAKDNSLICVKGGLKCDNCEGG